MPVIRCPENVISPIAPCWDVNVLVSTNVLTLCVGGVETVVCKELYEGGSILWRNVATGATIDPSTIAPCSSISTFGIRLVDTLPDGSKQEYLATYKYDDSGNFVAVVYTLTDGTTPYTPLSTPFPPTTLQVVRLDGNSTTQIAIPFTNFTGGTIGREYTLEANWKSFAAMWSPTNTDGSTLEMNDIGYIAPSPLPNAENSDGSEFFNTQIIFKAGADAVVEILIAK